MGMIRFGASNMMEAGAHQLSRKARAFEAIGDNASQQLYCLPQSLHTHTNLHSCQVLLARLNPTSSCQKALE